MSELVAMKGTKSGIDIVLNEEAAFEDLSRPSARNLRSQQPFGEKRRKQYLFKGKS